MNTCYFKLSLHAIMGSIAALFLTGAFAADVATHKVVDGVAIYLGVLPSEMLLGHPHSHTEAGMHGGVPPGEHRYHVMVALFDAATGKRITGAQVKATVSELALSGTEKNAGTYAHRRHHQLRQLLHFVRHRHLSHSGAGPSFGCGAGD